MTGPHTEVSEYADELLSVPRAHLSLELRQDEEGLLLYEPDDSQWQPDFRRRRL